MVAKRGSAWQTERSPQDFKAVLMVTIFEGVRSSSAAVHQMKGFTWTLQGGRWTKASAQAVGPATSAASVRNFSPDDNDDIDVATKATTMTCASHCVDGVERHRDVDVDRRQVDDEGQKQPEVVDDVFSPVRAATAANDVGRQDVVPNDQVDVEPPRDGDDVDYDNDDVADDDADDEDNRRGVGRDDNDVDKDDDTHVETVNDDSQMQIEVDDVEQHGDDVDEIRTRKDVVDDNEDPERVISRVEQIEFEIDGVNDDDNDVVRHEDNDDLKFVDADDEHFTSSVAGCPSSSSYYPGLPRRADGRTEFLGEILSSPASGEHDWNLQIGMDKIDEPNLQCSSEELPEFCREECDDVEKQDVVDDDEDHGADNEGVEDDGHDDVERRIVGDNEDGSADFDQSDQVIRSSSSDVLSSSSSRFKLVLTDDDVGRRDEVVDDVKDDYGTLKFAADDVDDNDVNDDIDRDDDDDQRRRDDEMLHDVECSGGDNDDDVDAEHFPAVMDRRGGSRGHEMTLSGPAFPKDGGGDPSSSSGRNGANMTAKKPLTGSRMGIPLSEMKRSWTTSHEIHDEIHDKIDDEIDDEIDDDDKTTTTKGDG